MEKKKLSNNLEYGDIVAIDRGYYQHFGIYVGNDQMIHYFPLQDNLTGKITIHITQFDTFLGEEEEYYICDFSSLEEKAENSSRVDVPTLSLDMLIAPKLNLSEQFNKRQGLQIAFARKKYRLYSREETVTRAYSRIGEESTQFIQDNCEHFAIWCKTGIIDTYEVNTVIKLLKSLWNVK